MDYKPVPEDIHVDQAEDSGVQVEGEDIEGWGGNSGDSELVVELGSDVDEEGLHNEDGDVVVVELHRPEICQTP